VYIVYLYIDNKFFLSLQQFIFITTLCNWLIVQPLYEVREPRQVK